MLNEHLKWSSNEHKFEHEREQDTIPVLHNKELDFTESTFTSIKQSLLYSFSSDW